MTNVYRAMSRDELTKLVKGAEKVDLPVNQQKSAAFTSSAMKTHALRELRRRDQKKLRKIKS